MTKLKRILVGLIFAGLAIPNAFFLKGNFDFFTVATHWDATPSLRWMESETRAILAISAVAAILFFVLGFSYAPTIEAWFSSHNKTTSGLLRIFLVGVLFTLAEVFFCHKYF